MGCIARLGCLIVLVIAALVGWVTRDNWMPRRLRSHLAPSAASRAIAWQPLTDAGAERTQAALAKLSQPRGPVYQTLSGADVASYAFRELSRQLPPSTDSIRSMVVGSQMTMRASMKVSDLGGGGALGALGILGDRQPVEFSGTLLMLRPGLAQFLIQDVKVRGISLPRGMITSMIRRFGKGSPRPADVRDDALPLPLPSYIGDIRVANGKVTLYKNVR